MILQSDICWKYLSPSIVAVHRFIIQIKIVSVKTTNETLDVNIFREDSERGVQAGNSSTGLGSIWWSECYTL